VSDTLHETYTRLVPASRKPTREQQLRYLALREEGLSHVRAARAVGSTGRRFVSLIRHDEEFRDLYNELFPDFEESLQERLRNEVLERAFDRRDPASPRLLALMAEARLSEFDYRRTRRVDQRTRLEHSTGLFIDPRSLNIEQLRQLRDKLAEIKAAGDGAEVIEASVVHELPEAASE
jgi:hypothetical protein